MRCEMLELKRCCFCIPLRYGLIVWAYLKLAVGIIVMLYLMMVLKALIQILFHLHDKTLLTTELVITATIVTVIVVDNALCVVFLVSAHRKLHRVMRVYFIYLLVVLGLTTALFLLFFVLRLTHFSRRVYADNQLDKLFAQSTAEFLNIVFQIYFIILVRSEIRKLSRNSQFRFGNNAVEAECPMVTTVVYEQSGGITLNNTETHGDSFYASEKPIDSEKLND